MHDEVFVTGGSGFVGSAVIRELLARNDTIRALTHRGKVVAGGERVRSIPADVFDSAALCRGMQGCDAVIHIIGIIMENPSRGMTFERVHFEGMKSVVDAAKAAGVKRYIHMSALGTRAGARSDYHKTKFKAEQYVRASGLDWTIFRPSLIHGPGGEFMRLEAAWARHQKPPFLFMPYFGRGILGMGGAGKLQPVFVNDVARAFVDAMKNPRTIGEVYPIGGSQVITWPQMHRIVAQAVTGRKRAVIALPAWYAKLVAAITPAALLPFNRDQVIMSQEDSTCDTTKFTDDFGWEPRAFEETLNSYAAQL